MAKKRPGSSSLPEDIIPIHEFYELPEHDIASVCGLIVDFLPVSKTRGLDHQEMITIKDDHFGKHTDKDNTLKIKIFNRNPRLMPPIERAGDVIYFKGLKRETWGGEVVGLNQWGTQFMLLLTRGRLHTSVKHDLQVDHPSGELSIVRPGSCGKASAELQGHAIYLTRRLLGPSGVAQSAIKPAFSARQTQHPPERQGDSFYDQRYLQIKDVNETCYSATLIGEIVKLFDNGEYLDVYITDYTSSSLLRDRAKGKDMTLSHPWVGPQGRMTLKIEVHEPTKSWMREHLAEKQIAMFRNVRCKFARDDSNLEATLWPDRKYTDKILVNEPNPGDERVEKLLENKRLYYNTYEPQNVHEALKDNTVIKKSTKSSRRREKKKQKERGQPANPQSPRKSLYEAGGASAPRGTTNSDLTIGRASLEMLSTFEDLIGNELRKIYIEEQGVPTTYTVHAPFININHKVRLRIVDYEPNEVFEFARQIKAMDGNTDTYEWDFMFLVVPDDTQGTDLAIPIHVDDRGGQELFGVQARAFVRYQRAYKEVEEKFVALVESALCNSKEECEEQPVSDHFCRQVSFQLWESYWTEQDLRPQFIAMSGPLEAIIQEYGLRCDDELCPHDASNVPWKHCDRGWRRIWRLQSIRTIDTKQPSKGLLKESSNGQRTVIAVEESN